MKSIVTSDERLTARDSALQNHIRRKERENMKRKAVEKQVKENLVGRLHSYYWNVALMLLFTRRR